MSKEVSFSKQELEGFMNALNTWAKSLPKNQQALLEHLIVRSQEAGGALSEDQLKNVAGGLMSISGSLLTTTRLRTSGFWAQWSSRQY